MLTQPRMPCFPVITPRNPIDSFVVVFLAADFDAMERTTGSRERRFYDLLVDP